MTGRRMLLAVALLATGMGLGLSDVALANDKCLVNTLRGLYVFSATGFTIPAAPASAQPKAIVEFILSAPSDMAAAMIDRDAGEGTKNGKRGDSAKQ